MAWIVFPRLGWRSSLGTLTVSLALVGCFNDASAQVEDDEDGSGTSSAGTTSTSPTSTSTETDASGSGSSSPGTAGSSTDAPTSSTDAAAESSSGRTDDTDEPPQMCGAGQVCRPSLPMDWQGPAAVSVGDDTASRPGMFVPHPPLVRLNEPPEGSCNCACTNIDVQCETTLAVTQATDLNCMAPTVIAEISDSCSTSIASVPNARIDVGDFSASATCQSPTATGFFAQLDTSPVLVCDAPAEVGMCPGGECFAPAIASLDHVCAFRPGIHTCPPDQPYSERFIVGESLTDDRSCPQCTCNEPAGLICNGTPVIHTNDSCVGAGTPITEGCQTVPTDGSGFNARLTDVNFIGDTCSPADATPDPLGDVTTVDPLTLCCL